MREEMFSADALLSREERIMIYALVSGLRPTRALEVGTCRGGSAQIICWAMDDVGRGRLDCIDPAPQTDLAHVPRATLHKAPSPSAVHTVAATGGGFDFAFIDGDHSRPAVFADLCAVFPYLSPLAYILLHDAHNECVAAGIADALGHLPGVVDCGIVTRSECQVGGEKWGGLRLLARGITSRF